MVQTNSILVIATAAFLVFGFSAAALGGGKVGGWTPIKDPKDPTVQEIGQFAVTEHNKEAKANLKFTKVVKGETQVVAGKNYRLVISATDGSSSGNYEAVVWDKPFQHYRSLTSFKQL